MKNYAPHAKSTKGAEGGIEEHSLKESACPYYVTEAYYHVYSSEESPRVWYEFKQKRTGARYSYSFLDSAVVESLKDPGSLQSPRRLRRPFRQLGVHSQGLS